MKLSTGVDLIEIRRVEEVIQRHDRRFLDWLGGAVDAGDEAITVDDLDLTSMILLAENSRVRTSMSNRVARTSRRWAELRALRTTVCCRSK